MGNQVFNRLGFVHGQDAAPLHGYHNGSGGRSTRIVPHGIPGFPTHNDGNPCVLNPVEHPDGSPQPVLQVINGNPLFVRFRRHQAAVIQIYIVGKAAFRVPFA